MCLSGPEFSITGNLSYPGQQVGFQATFNTPGDESLVKLFEWYLNDEIVFGNDKLFNEKVGCGTHQLGLRILTSDGWSGIKQISFQTCAGPLSVSFNGPENVNEGSSAAYQLIANYAGGQTENVTSQYTFSSTEGTFSGSTLTIPANSLTGDSRQITLTASKAGSPSLTRQIMIVDKTVPQSIVITGPGSITEGSSTTYAIIATYQGGNTENLTSQYSFSSTEGVFSGPTLTIPANSTTSDSRQITITASKSGLASLTKQVSVVDQTVPQSIVISGPASINEGSSATYSIIATYQDGNTENLTSQYIFSSTEGVFSGTTLTIPANSTTSDSRQITITAVKSGSASLTKQVSVIDQTVPQSIVISGPGSINEGSSATYTVIATYQDGNTQNLTSQYSFISTEGIFSGATLTISSNPVNNDTRQITITASKTGSSSLSKTVTINDASPVVLDYISINGSTSLNEGNIYNYSVTAHYSNGTTTAVTAGITFSLQATGRGIFSGNQLTVNSNQIQNDTIQTSITATYQNKSANLNITINDSTQIVIEDEFDYMVVRYYWESTAGIDLDIIVGYENNNTIADKKYVGYGNNEQNPTYPQSTLPETNALLWWAEDNQTGSGYEAVLIGIRRFIQTYPNSPNTVEVGLYAAWFDSKKSGNFRVELTTYKGGTMSKSGNNLINTGGNLVSSNVFNVHTDIVNQTSQAVNFYNVGKLRYDKANKSAVITLTNPPVQP